MYSTHASVVMVKPAGTRSGPRTRVISATFAPLPPRSSRMSLDPSAKSYTHFVTERSYPRSGAPWGAGDQTVSAVSARGSRSNASAMSS